MSDKSAKPLMYGKMVAIGCGLFIVIAIICEFIRGNGEFRLSRFLLWCGPLCIFGLLNVLAYGNRPVEEVNRLQRHPETLPQKIMRHVGTIFFAVVSPAILWINYMMR